MPEHGKDMRALTSGFGSDPDLGVSNYEDMERHTLFASFLSSPPRITELEIRPLPIEPSLVSIAAGQSLHLTSLTLIGLESNPIDPQEAVSVLCNAKQLRRLDFTDIASADEEVMSSVVAAVRGLEQLRMVDFVFLPHAFVEGLNPVAPLTRLYLVDIPDVGPSQVFNLLRAYRSTLEEVDLKPIEVDLQPLTLGSPLLLPKLEPVSSTPGSVAVFSLPPSDTIASCTRIHHHGGRPSPCDLGGST